LADLKDIDLRAAAASWYSSLNLPDCLTPTEAAVLWLLWDMDLSQEHSGELLGLSYQSVWFLQNRAFKKIRGSSE